MAQQQEPIIQNDQPTPPWDFVSADILSLHGEDYIVTVDHFSKFFQVDRLPTMSTATVVKKLKMYFSRYGTPYKFLTDITPQEFRRFAFKLQFQHIISSPYYSKWHGTAESMGKVAKTIMKKTKEAKSDIYLALLAYRNTPKQDIGLSPAQLMMGRRTKTLIPTAETLLAPETVKPNLVAVNKRQMRIRNNYDSHAKALKYLKVGDSVMMQPVRPNHHMWRRGIITKELNNRSYEMQPEDGHATRRNCVHLHPVAELAPPAAGENNAGDNADATAGIRPTRIHQKTCGALRSTCP